jgi:hypothetical protein
MPDIPDHIANLRSNVAEVKRLVSIHVQLTGSGPGPRYDVQVLNKSGVLMIVATWESFIESLVLTSSNFLAAQIKEPHQIPKSPKSAISNRLKADKHNDSVWLLAGEGWKNQLTSHAKEKMSRLHAPTAENVDALFSSTLGFDRLSSHWYWPGCTNSSVIRRLDSLLELRHEIAHGVKTSRSVTKKYVQDSNTFVIRLAAISSNRLSRHLFSTTGKIPWTMFVKGAAR